mgnify:CR=1 FL=1
MLDKYKYFVDDLIAFEINLGKKIKVINEVALSLGLKNVIGIHERVEKIPGRFDFIVSRAVAPLAD